MELSNLYSSQSLTMVIKPRTAMMTHATGMQQIKKTQNIWVEILEKK
jgi:hypothetical protein